MQKDPPGWVVFPQVSAGGWGRGRGGEVETLTGDPRVMRHPAPDLRQSNLGHGCSVFTLTQKIGQSEETELLFLGKPEWKF